MKKVFMGFFLGYALLAIFNAGRKSSWLVDSILAVLLLAVLYIIYQQFSLSLTSVLLGNIALSLHVLGSFGLYSLSYNYLSYDMLVHSFGAFAAAIIFSELMHKKTRLQGNLFAFFVVSSVVFMGFLVELLEFSGFLVFGNGDGILMAGSGDFDFSALSGQYIDTIMDLIFNLLGSIAGTAFTFWQGLTYYRQTAKAKA